ncbi:BadF/BadG/BcrA/BcrD ATPase family protein [Acetobacter conturbans]|uniref:BadF/BadG/BcrA/BcrD ATPase family protein n=1 Tax=Acetobacter conturbans TaxID=1737472 RepID=UPI001F552DF2|nr:BadF/BadG/BcrA/BcrD ATPase family protein [Acetobacter conturbans]
MVAIDGGATKTLLRIVTPDGDVLGEGRSGPANIATDTEQAARSIRAAFDQAIFTAELTEDVWRGAFTWVAAAGLAGAEVAGCSDRIRDLCEFLTVFDVRTDAYTSCLGAHGGRDGAIVAIGTGSVGFAIRGEQTHRVGGWGFPQGDEGGGAHIGLKALRHMLWVADGRTAETELARDVCRYIRDAGGDPLTWGIGASATKFALLTPIVTNAAQKECKIALGILDYAASNIEVIANTLLQGEDFSSLKLAFLGGLSPVLMPRLSKTLSDRIVFPEGSSLDGATALVRKVMEHRRA